MLRALAGAHDLEAAQPRPLHELADQRRLVAVGERVDDARGLGPPCQQRADERVGLDVDHHDVPPRLDRQERVLDAGRRIAGRLDHDVDAGRGDQRRRVVGEPGRAAPSASSARRPAASGQPAPSSRSRTHAGARSATPTMLDAGRAPRLRRGRASRTRHRRRPPRRSGARRPRAPRAVPAASAPPRRASCHGGLDRPGEPAASSSSGARRARLRAEIWRFSSSRRSTAPRPGRVGRRGVLGRSASPIMRARRSRAMRRFWCWLRSSWRAGGEQARGADARAQALRQLRALLLVEREIVHGDRDRHGAVGRVDVLAARAARARGAQRQRRVREGALAGGDRVIGRGVGHSHLLHTMPHGRVPRALSAAQPLIGVIHLPPLPGYPGSPGLAAVVAHALAELATYRVGGLDGVLVENENDRPHRVEAGRETIAVMTAVTRARGGRAIACPSASRSCSTTRRPRSPSRSRPAPPSSARTTSSTR